MYSQLIAEFVEQESLPESYGKDAGKYFAPLVERLATESLNSTGTLLVGINGAQGTGKTTLSKMLTCLLHARELVVVNLSIDDFYLRKSEREQLANSIHPLLRTRGVPGTHDTELLAEKIADLDGLEKGSCCEIPRFNKAIDDRYPATDFPTVTGPVDIVLLEGWFVGASPLNPNELKRPVNALEAKEDEEAIWRKYVNDQLAGSYQGVFQKLDLLILLKAPSFDQVYEWRALQEEKLRKLTSTETSALMDEEGLLRFIQHFERLTHHCLTTLPDKADVLLELSKDHRITQAVGLNC